MIDQNEVTDALERRLIEEWVGSDVRFVQENDDAIPERPYLFSETMPLNANDPTLKGDYEKLLQRFIVSVVTERGTFARNGRAIAAQVRQLFPKDLKLAITGAEITITAPPFMDKGFPDGFDWRIPVRIDYEVD